MDDISATSLADQASNADRGTWACPNDEWLNFKIVE